MEQPSLLLQFLVLHVQFPNQIVKNMYCESSYCNTELILLLDVVGVPNACSPRAFPIIS
jgi:hypothetical protein